MDSRKPHVLWMSQSVQNKLRWDVSRDRWPISSNTLQFKNCQKFQKSSRNSKVERLEIVRVSESRGNTAHRNVPVALSYLLASLLPIWSTITIIESWLFEHLLIPRALLYLSEIIVLMQHPVTVHLLLLLLDAKFTSYITHLCSQ